MIQRRVGIIHIKEILCSSIEQIELILRVGPLKHVPVFIHPTVQRVAKLQIWSQWYSSLLLLNRRRLKSLHIGWWLDGLRLSKLVFALSLHHSSLVAFLFNLHWLLLGG